MRTSPGALPNLVIIGSMKAGTSALHHYLDLHPDVAMSEPKELNFFFEGPAGRRSDFAPQDDNGAAWSAGNWQRGTDWYAGHFSAGTVVRGESSPGYTSPGREAVARRMASTIPGARLIYLVRDPVARAISQYRHHVREGTERRSPEEALLDPESHYIQRSRYFERLQPFLMAFPADRIGMFSMEDLLSQRRTTLRSIFEFVGVDGSFWCSELDRRTRAGSHDDLRIDPSVERSLREVLAEDAARLRAYAGRSFDDWSI